MTSHLYKFLTLNAHLRFVHFEAQCVYENITNHQRKTDIVKIKNPLYTTQKTKDKATRTLKKNY